MYLADCLSRAFLKGKGDQDDIENISMVEYLPISEERLKAIQQATECDEHLQMLKKVVLEGWPNDKQDVPIEAMPYFSYRDEISLQDGLLFRGERVIIPKSMRQEMKVRIHSSHMGIDACLRRARECLYWPNMSSEIQDYVATCAICSRYQTGHTKESLMSHDVPDRPWAKVGTDL